MEVSGAPAVMPGDTITIKDIPAKHPLAALLQGAHSLRVRGVRHTFSRTDGFITRMEF
jgi:hypothetical protein